VNWDGDESRSVGSDFEVDGGVESSRFTSDPEGPSEEVSESSFALRDFSNLGRVTRTDERREGSRRKPRMSERGSKAGMSDECLGGEEKSEREGNEFSPEVH